MNNSASNPSVLLESEKRRIRKLYESTTAANSGSYSQPMAWSEETPSPCADETYGDDNIVDGSEELTLDVDELMGMLNLSEKQEKERIRKLHKENSVVKEQARFAQQILRAINGKPEDKNIKDFIKEYGVEKFIEDFNNIEDPKKRIELIAMLKRAGVKLDSYDDHRGSILKDKDPKLQSIL